MIQENDFVGLERVSKYLGNSLEYIQGGGGNTSVKLDKSVMAIKASGIRLADVSSTSGFVKLNHDWYSSELIKRLDSLTEGEYIELGINALVEGEIQKGRPSIETSLHALLPEKYVIHSHSVYSNILTCSQEGRKWCEDKLAGSIFLDYAAPGIELSKVLLKKIDPREKSSKVIFLQNHGLVITGESADEVIEKHEKLNISFKAEFNIEENLEIKKLVLKKDEIIFPDQAVFILKGESPSFHENLSAAEFIIRYIKKNNWNPAFLTLEQVDFLLNMDSEKYRARIDK